MRITRTRVFTQVNFERAKKDNFGQNGGMAGRPDQSSSRRKSSMDSSPFRPGIHSATASAPDANPSRECAVCVMLISSVPEEYVMVCVPGNGSLRSEEI